MARPAVRAAATGSLLAPAAARQTAEPATATRVPRARTRTTVPPPFPPWSDSLLRACLVLVGIAVLGVPLLLMAWVRSPQITWTREPNAQPIAFDHMHHVLPHG